MKEYQANLMQIDDLNELLKFISCDFQIEDVITTSGQRKVYTCRNGDSKYIMKICALHPTTVARIQREIKILRQIQSKYFPQFHFEYFITDEEIRNFIDNFNSKNQKDKIEHFESLNIKPFLITVEENIEHKKWNYCLEHLGNQKNLVIFLLYLFDALKLLWNMKIVHRDLKPENILIRPNYVPVVIDLGIAKSMVDGATIITHPVFPSPCTPKFASPEQLFNNKAEITYKSDHFSIGVISFLILTNRFPYGNCDEIGIEGVMKNFANNTMERINTHNKTAHKRLVTLIEKLLRVEPYQRFRNVEDIITELQNIKELL